MKRTSFLISKYLLGSVGPYFLFSWALLTVILFLQQASRYADFFFSPNMQSELIWQLMIGLVPNVIAFTCPMAVLVGTVIGLSKMQGDSELVAIRAAGVGNAQIALPIVLLGVILSAFAFWVNIQGVPIAAAVVRRVAMQAAIAKFESPIEPGVFYSEVEGFTILARSADESDGQLKNVFISQKDQNNGVYRLVTSEVGRMDINGEATELVLDSASVVTMPIDPSVNKYSIENLHNIRVALKTKRAEMLERLSSVVRLPDELGLDELKKFASAAEGKDKIEAEIIFQRRITMSLTPLVFCLLGTGLVLRFRRGGRGFGIVLALIGLIGYYLVAFLGEQLARSGWLGTTVSGSLPLMVSAVAIVWLFFGAKLKAAEQLSSWFQNVFEAVASRSKGLSMTNTLIDVTSGIRDFDIAISLAKFFFLASGFLLAVFLIFTAFETWRFAASIDGGTALLGKYLLYLTPFAYLQIAPSAAMIAALAAYTIRSRNNELVTWASAGQSVFRILLPCFALAIALGVSDFAIQELIAARANRIQDDLRSQLRSGGTPDAVTGRRWYIDGGNIYSFTPQSSKLTNERSATTTDVQQTAISASDNETASTGVDRREVGYIRSTPLIGDASNEDAQDVTERVDFALQADSEQGSNGILKDHGSAMPVSGVRSTLAFAAPSIILASDNETGGSTCYSCVSDVILLQFKSDKKGLQAVYRSTTANFADGVVTLGSDATKVNAGDGPITAQSASGAKIAAGNDPFRTLGGKPNHLTVSELRDSAGSTTSASEQRIYLVTVQKRLSFLIMPLVIIMFAVPWAISLQRMAMVSSLSTAVALWLVFIGVTNVMEQYGTGGSLSPMIAIWAPLGLFGLLGIFLVSRIRT